MQPRPEEKRARHLDLPPSSSEEEDEDGGGSGAEGPGDEAGAS